LEEFGGYQPGFDVVQAFAKVHLCQYHAQKPVEISEVLDFAFLILPSGALLKLDKELFFNDVI